MEINMDGPAMAPPAGVIPNLVNPPNNNGVAWGVLLACASFATICLVLRGYARGFLLRKFQTEEVLVVIAYGCFWGATYCTLALIKTPGYFVHTWNVRLRDVIPTNYYVLVFGNCYSVTLPALKIAILVEWCRMFAPRGNRMKSPFWWGCVFVIAVQIAANIGIIVALNLQCIPHKAIYDFRVPGKCFNLYTLQVASASIHLICDILILALPQHVIWTLKMSWRKRLGVSIIFGLGLLACVSAAFRLAMTVAHGESADGIFTLGPLAFWAMAEMTCGFFIICLPCIPKILKETGIARQIKKLTTGGSSNYNNYKPSYDRYGVSTQRSNHSKLGVAATPTDYYKIGNEGVRMETLKGTESTERLHDGLHGTGGAGITRTTRITVTEGEGPLPNHNGASRYMYP